MAKLSLLLVVFLLALCLVSDAKKKKKDKKGKKLKDVAKKLAEKAGKSGCGSVITNEDGRGKFATPGYRKGAYKNGEDCSWTLKLVEENSFMHLRLSKVKIEADRGCNKDYLLVYDNVNGKLLGKFCGTKSADVVIPSNQARVVFRSNFGITDRGVKFAFWAVDSSERGGVVCSGSSYEDGHCIHCGGTLDASSGTIQSPYLGDFARYPGNLFCEWVIATGTGQKIEFTFESLDMDDDKKCQKDNVRIFGPTSGSPLATVCGKKCDPVVVVPFDTARVTFTSDDSGYHKGFKMNYMVVSTDVEEGLDCNCEAGDGCMAYDPMAVSKWFAECSAMQLKLEGSDVEGHGTRVHGGEEVVKHELPWQIMLKLDGVFACGGSIIHHRWIVTAAHCFEHTIKERYSIMVGGHDFEGGTDVAVKQIINHPKYSTVTQEHDITLMELEEPLEWVPNPYEKGKWKIAPICLTRRDPYPKTKCIMSGWGKTETADNSDVLLKAEVPIIAQEKCKEAGYGEHLFKGMVCAGKLGEGGTDTCQGDSGGPLVCRQDQLYVLQGVTSWGWGCGSKNYPGVYTRISRYIDWITHNTGITFA